jgi:uncharacterized membrane protein HdeD (DUF308 family)
MLSTALLLFQEERMFTHELIAGMENVGLRWKWFLILGLLLVVFGIYALIVTPAATLGTVIVLGLIVAMGGLFEIIHTFQVRQVTVFFLHLLAGSFAMVVGLLMLTHPQRGAAAWTLVFACYFLVFGIFRAAMSLTLRFDGWGWALFDSIVTLILGVLLWVEWPSSSIWFIGLAIGISMVLRGWSLIVLAVAIRRLANLTQKPLMT